MTTKQKAITVKHNPLVRLDDNERVLALLRERRTWHTKKSSGGMTQRNSDVIGVFMAQAVYLNCEQCKHYNAELSQDDETYGYPCYTVYSYNTVMYHHCTLCGDTYVNASFYSNYTRSLQKTLASAYPSYKEELNKQKELEREARKLWAKDRAAGRVSSDRLLGYTGGGQPHYSRAGNLHEMLEYMLGHRLPGHHIHSME